jgi:DNA polymerase III epsilon subunit-like protein
MEIERMKNKDTSIIIFDTETTDLSKAEGADLKHQPHMTEIYCYKVNKKLKEVDTFHSLIKPPIPIPAFITKLTGIDDYKLRNAPSFLEIAKDLAFFFLGCRVIVAHNLSYDLKMIRFEMARIGKEFNFPYPPIHFCNVEQSLHIRGHRLKNDELYEIATGKKLLKSHRAEVDVMATFESYKWLLKQIKRGSK